jgi:hypothetical protein
VNFFASLLFSFSSYVVIVSLLKQARWSNYRRLKKGGWNYVRFMCLLLCFHVFHFLLFMILISLSHVEQVYLEGLSEGGWNIYKMTSS